MDILVTGGCGFIGNALVRHLLADGHRVANVDKLTYAASPAALADLADAPGYRFRQADIADGPAIGAILAAFRPQAIFHLAAESHVDRSIESPAAFIKTNILGTYALLEAALAFWRTLPANGRQDFRFVHVSTDEVFGPLPPDEHATETSRYDPSSPYAAAKASSDHLVRAWGRTYSLPVILCTCTNNYGPWQFPEKVIPRTIIRALLGQALPLYGDGLHTRDWIHVDDHIAALDTILQRGSPQTTYAIGAEDEHVNHALMTLICQRLDALAGPLKSGRPRQELICHVADRPGHDRRYSLDSTHLRQELGWKPRHRLASSLDALIAWYQAHTEWWRPILARAEPQDRPDP